MDMELLDRLERENDQLRSKNNELNTALATSAFQARDNDDHIRYQLDSSDLLEYLEHSLRGDKIKTDKEGNQFWYVLNKEEAKELLVLNDYGINSLLSVISPYLNRLTSLSFYNVERINEIMADLGEELTLFVFCNYEKMGMDTQYKKSRYGILVVSILHIVESNYRRAIQGRTSEDINTSKVGIMNQGNNVNQMPMKKRFHMFKPSTW